MSVRHFILNNKDPFHAARRFVPVYIFMVGFVIAMVTMVKGLKHIGLDLSFEQALFLLRACFWISDIDRRCCHFESENESPSQFTMT